MPTVPYDPNPSVKPDTGATTRPIRINTTEDMFGANIGKATEKLGSVLSHVGDEFATTAIQFARLDAETQAAKQATKTYTETGNLDARFRTMQGEDPANNLQQHNKALDDIRLSNRGGLSAYAAKLYDQQTLRSQGYDMRNSAIYSAGEFKKAAKVQRNTLIDQKIDSLIRQADTSDDEAVKTSVGEIAQLETQNSIQDGDSKAVLSSRVENVIAKTVDAMAKHKAKSDPDAAKDFLQKFEGKIHYGDYQNILDKIEDQGITTRAEAEATRIANPMSEILKRAREVTAEQESGKKSYGNVTTTFSKRLGHNQSALGRYGIMDFDLAEWSKAATGREVSQEEFMKSPEIQDQVYNHRMGGYITKYGIEGAGRAWLGGEGGVNHPERTDPLGTSIGNYGRSFAAKVGAVQPRDTSQQSLVDKQREVENAANKYYMNDPARRERFIDQTMRGVLNKSSVQQKELNDRKVSLDNSIESILKQKLQNGRAPTSTAEARTVDPKFDDYFDELRRYDPKYQDKVNHIFAANAKEDIPETQERRDFHTRYLGMDNVDKMKVDPYKAFNEGLTTKGLADKIAEDQAKIKHGVEQGQKVDPILLRNHALLNDMKAYPSKTEPEANQRYLWLRGAATQRMEAFEAAKKAPMSVKDEEDMIKDLARETVTKPGFFGTSFWQTKQRQFEIEGPTAGQIRIQNGWQYRPDGTPIGPVKQ